jgi:hypothetical protein
MPDDIKTDDDIKTAQDVERLKTALTKERTDHRVLRDKLKQVQAQLAEREALGETSSVATIKNHINNVVKSTVAQQTADQLRQIATLQAQLKEAQAATEVGTWAIIDSRRYGSRPTSGDGCTCSQ